MSPAAQVRRRSMVGHAPGGMIPGTIGSNIDGSSDGGFGSLGDYSKLAIYANPTAYPVTINGVQVFLGPSVSNGSVDTYIAWVGDLNVNFSLAHGLMELNPAMANSWVEVIFTAPVTLTGSQVVALCCNGLGDSFAYKSKATSTFTGSPIS